MVAASWQIGDVGFKPVQGFNAQISLGENSALASPLCARAVFALKFIRYATGEIYPKITGSP
jgi:hypothetical protein